MINSFSRVAFLAFCAASSAGLGQTGERGEPILYRKVDVPEAFLADRTAGGAGGRFGGDIRIGDLDGDGRADFLVYRSSAGGMKPCFLGAFDESGKVLWTAGSGGGQPLRPGPVAVHDLDADGGAEVTCFFVRGEGPGSAGSMEDVSIQVRDGKTGRVEREAAPAELTSCRGEGANWFHQRILVANLKGDATPGQFVVKLGERLLAFDRDLSILWTYKIAWNEYGRCSAYVPAVGDIDGDGKDEVLGGYYLLDHDGRAMWERPVGLNMDSVAIAPWDGGKPRAFCSGFGQILDAEGNVLLSLGGDVVPHGQEVRVDDFIAEAPGPEMVIRHLGHQPDVLVVGKGKEILQRFRLNDSPNQTGMEAVHWSGSKSAALLYSGGELWFADGRRFSVLPGLPPPAGDPKMGWYHCIPADVCGDEREEAVVYNPWDGSVLIFTPRPLQEGDFKGYRPGPRQYNPRLMD
jgi:hypothetical protein